MNTTRLIHGLGRAARRRELAARYLLLLADPSESMIGTLSENEIPLLRQLVEQAGSVPGPIVEVGTLFGFSTQCIALAKEPSKRLITIDNYSWNPIGLDPEHHRELTRGALRYLIERCNTSIFEGTSAEFYASYASERPAMVFIDASHDYEDVLADLRWAKQMRIPIISGHDYGAGAVGVTRAVDEVFGAPTKLMGRVWAWVDPQLDASLPSATQPRL